MKTEFERFKSLRPEFDEPGPVVFAQYSYIDTEVLEIVLVKLKGKYQGCFSLKMSEIRNGEIVLEKEHIFMCAFEANSFVQKSLYFFCPVFKI